MGDNNDDLNAISLKVTDEVKKLGDNVKATYDELRQNHNKLKEIVERNKGDQYDKTYIDKLATDISVRQEALDKQSKEIQEQIKKRVDEIEAAVNRPGLPSGDVKTEDEKQLKTFQMNCLAARKGNDSVKDEDLLKPISMDEFKAYQKAFIKFVKSPDLLNGLTPEERKILSVGVDPHGGYTITPAMSNRILQKLFEMDPIRRLATVESITGPYIEWFVDWDEAEAGWEGETETGAETSTPDLGMRRIDAFTMYAKPKLTQNILEDSGINIETWLANKVADKFLRKEAAAFVSADGIKKPRGFLTYPASTTDDEYGKIKQVAMGAPAALTADGFISVKYELLDYYLNSANLAWLMRRSTVAAAMKLKDGTGDYIWKPGFTTDQRSTILGVSVEMVPTMPAVAPNALSVALADWREAYVIVDRLGITIQRDPYTKKPYTEFYTRKRVGGDVVNFQAIKLGKIA